jgi:hypothetical protein
MGEDMNTTKERNTGYNKKSWHFYVAVLGFIIILGVVVREIIVHSTFLYYNFILPIVDRVFIEILTTKDTIFDGLYKTLYLYEIISSILLFIYVIVILPLYLMRKSIVPKLMTIFAIASTANNCIYTILTNIQNQAVRQRIGSDLITSLIFIGLNIILLTYLLTSNSYRELFKG